MRFGVLGPLAVWTDAGAPVVVPGALVRALLADLLVHRRSLVTADRLIEDLWGADAPRQPLGALQVKVSQLRRALDGAEPGARGLVVSDAARAGDRRPGPRRGRPCPEWTRLAATRSAS